MQSLYSPTAVPGLQVLAPAQIEEILQAAFLILERTGAQVNHSEMLARLKKAGAEVEGERVYAPRHLIQNALAQAPKGLMIYDQNGTPALHLWGRKSFFGTSTASPKTRDALTGEIHDTRLVDLEMGARVADRLEHIDFAMPFGSAQDWPTPLGEAWEVLAMLKHTKKPLVFCPYSPKGVETVLEIAGRVAGGAEALRRRPFIIAYPEPISPLTWPDHIVDFMTLCAERHCPQLVTGAQMMSMTAPVTMAGVLAQGTAEALFSNFIVQTVRPGAPVFMAAIPCSVNSRNGLVSMAGPEFQLAISAQAEVARWVGLPTWGCAGVSDSHILDAQAGAESGLTILIQALAGLNLIHDVGYLGTGMQCSAAMMLFGNEVIGFTKRILRGLTVDENFLATEIIHQAGPGGNFLTSKHTVRNLRSEIFTNELFHKIGYDQWRDQGNRSCQEKADDQVRAILEKPPAPTLTADQVKMLEDLINARS